MDVRCEKCHTEYELDEARLKPGGVTVKCTNCGHMFKIRKRTPTSVGAAAPAENARSRPVSARPNEPASASPRDSTSGENTAVRGPGTEGDERQWFVRLENGEQRQCRELAMLQQWIVAGTVTRESLISRSGKTWKRLGDITELAQYFVIADEARSKRAVKQVPGTMLGIGMTTAAGGTILPDDDDELERRSTGNYPARGNAGSTTPSSPTPVTPPPMAAEAASPPATQPPAAVEPAPRRPLTQPPPPPGRKNPSIPIGNRSTAAWATDGLSPEAAPPAGPAGPLSGRIKASTSEPAFAGRVRMEPGDDSAFNSGRVKPLDDDDHLMPGPRGTRAGLWIVLILLLVGGAAGAVYVLVIKDHGAQPVVTVADAAVDADATPDATLVVTPMFDAAPAVASPIDLARAELGPDNEQRLRAALASLDGAQEPGSDAMRVHLAASIAQGLLDRAAITADKAEAKQLKQEAKTLVANALGPAQRAVKATPGDAVANLAMAEALRLQAKPARDVKRYLDVAKAKATPDWKRDLALAEGLVLQRDAKLDDAKATYAAIDQGDDRLETSGDVRARMRLALIAYAQNKPADAKPLAEQVLAAQPDHASAKALIARIETTVAKSDPLPPEDPKDGSSKTSTGGGGGDTYDRLLTRANILAESNCSKAMDLFGKALEQKPNGVEALTGMGYCHIDAKQFSSAFSKFRAALAVSPRYEPALWGVAEAYQQQGRKEQALESVKAYLEVYPHATKGQKALDRLGGGSTPAPGPGAGSEKPPTPPDPAPAATPAPAPTPAPAATPAPDGAGSGSG